MNLYPWSCPACKNSNLAISTNCASCGCPAYTTAAQIERFAQGLAPTGDASGHIATSQSRVQSGWITKPNLSPAEVAQQELPFPNPQRPPIALQVVLCFAALGAMLGFMYYAFTFPSPSGKPLSVWAFIAFSLREIAILVLAAAGLVALLVAWLVMRARRLLQSPRHEL